MKCIYVCKCGHDEIRHEIPIITEQGPDRMPCYLCSCSNYATMPACEAA